MPTQSPPLSPAVHSFIFRSFTSTEPRLSSHDFDDYDYDCGKWPGWKNSDYSIPFEGFDSITVAQRLCEDFTLYRGVILHMDFYIR